MSVAQQQCGLHSVVGVGCLAIIQYLILFARSPDVMIFDFNLREDAGNVGLCTKTTSNRKGRDDHVVRLNAIQEINLDMPMQGSKGLVPPADTSNGGSSEKRKLPFRW